MTQSSLIEGLSLLAMQLIDNSSEMLLKFKALARITTCRRCCEICNLWIRKNMPMCHEDLGWLNHEAYYEAAMQMHIDEAYVEESRGHNQNPLPEAERIKNNFRQVAYRILDLVNTDYYLNMSAEQRDIRYRAKHDTVVTDRRAVAAGNATDRQFKQNAVELQSFRAYHDMSAMLRVMQSLDPAAYAKVPEIFKTGLKHQRLSNARQQRKTLEKIQDRLERFISQDMDFAPYSDNVMDTTLSPLIARVTVIMRENLAYIGFSMMDGPAL
jgi:hypothetical protein